MDSSRRPLPYQISSLRVQFAPLFALMQTLSHWILFNIHQSLKRHPTKLTSRLTCQYSKRRQHWDHHQKVLNVPRLLVRQHKGYLEHNNSTFFCSCTFLFCQHNAIVQHIHCIVSQHIWVCEPAQSGTLVEYEATAESIGKFYLCI